MMCFFVALLMVTAAGAPPQIQATDIVAGYRQNFAEFRTLHVQWQRVLTNAENFFKRLEAAAHDLEEQSARQGIEPEERARLLSQAEGYLGMAAHPKNIAPTVVRQDFWTDRTGFQMRLPSPSLGDQQTEWRYPPSAPGIDTKALLTHYKDTAIICFDGRADNGFRVWDGYTKGDIHVAGIQKSAADSDSTHFPPLGLVNPEWGSSWHPFDDFFAGPIEQLRVVREERVAGRRTYVVERVSETQHKELRLKPEHIKRFGERIKIFDIVRAWVDPARGYIPLKMEWDGEKWYDGKLIAPLKKKIPSFRIIDNVEIRQVAGTQGYYPVRCEMHLYAVEAGYRGPFVTVGDVIEGKQPVVGPNRLDQECLWEVSLVEANRDMSGLLSLRFPDNTAYYDARQSRAFVTGDAKKMLDDALAKQEAPPQEARWHTARVALAVVIVVGTLALAFMRINRRRRRTAGK
jgi:hypothetical protein